ELINQHDSIPELRQVLERQKIVMSGSGSSMKTEDGSLRRPSNHSIEELESENLDVALDRFHRPAARRGIRASTDDCLGPRTIGPSDAITGRGSRPRRSAVRPLR